MLEAALQRHYSGAPEQFFTGGGAHTFANFASWEDSANPTVLEAFENSINLSFIRVMRDVVNYYIAADGIEVKRLLNDPDNPAARRISAAFRRGRQPALPVSLLSGLPGSEGRGPARYAGRASVGDAPQARGRVHDAASARADRRALQIPGRAPAADPVHRGAALGLYLSYSPDRMSLSDRGYVAGVHPMELWLVRYLQDHPGASWDEVLDASATVRQEAYAWLLNGNRQAQNTRIRIILEQDAFNRIYDNWRAVGFPFGHLVPSLGTAIGSSGDRPAALAELMGIISSGGMRLPTAAIDRLRFAARHAVRDHSRTACRTRARIAGGGRAHAAAGAAGGRHRRHRAPRQQCLRRCRRAASRRRRQDRNRRQPLSAIWFRRRADLVEGGQPHRHLRVLYRRPVFRNGNGLCRRRRTPTGSTSPAPSRCSC